MFSIAFDTCELASIDKQTNHLLSSPSLTLFSRVPLTGARSTG